MRLIGNKTRLLSSIQRFLSQRGWDGGTLIDIFSGTASVGRYFKSLGWRVLANDHLSVAFTKAVAGIEVSDWPKFRAFRDAHRNVIASPEFQDSFSVAGAQSELSFEPARTGRAGTVATALKDHGRPLREVIHVLDRYVAPREGLISRSFCPSGSAGRMYFQDEHGRKIDGILETLREAWRGEILSRGELHLCLASLIDAADRVANISGTYGAYLKSWQVNTRGALRLSPPEVLCSSVRSGARNSVRNEAFQEDSNRLVRRLNGDVLYIDPPYNHRQYAANYHVLEILAEHHRVPDLAAYEASLYGKTGLRPYAEQRSTYCVSPDARDASDGNALSSLADLVLASRARAVVVSYSEEGLLSREEIGGILAAFGRAKKFDYARGLLAVDFPRFRSDSDREGLDGRSPRRYSGVEGRSRDRVGELLFYAERPTRKRTAVAGVTTTEALN